MIFWGSYQHFGRNLEVRWGVSNQLIGDEFGVGQKCVFQGSYQISRQKLQDSVSVHSNQRGEKVAKIGAGYVLEYLRRYDIAQMRKVVQCIFFLTFSEGKHLTTIFPKYRYLRNIYELSPKGVLFFPRNEQVRDPQHVLQAGVD